MRKRSPCPPVRTVSFVIGEAAGRTQRTSSAVIWTQLAALFTSATVSTSRSSPPGSVSAVIRFGCPKRATRSSTTISVPAAVTSAAWAAAGAPRPRGPWPR